VAAVAVVANGVVEVCSEDDDNLDGPGIALASASTSA
jgi:hypothetical protein